MRRRIIVRKRAKTLSVNGPTVGGQTGKLKLINVESYNRFNSSVLGLGDIAAPAREIEAISAVFDLAGFTKFCNQVDPHLEVPRFLSSFLDWLFGRVRMGVTEGTYADCKALWAELPIMSKFLGDGVLFLWSTQGLSESLICKIVTTLYEISASYRSEFYSKISASVDKPPAVLRCGVARGRIFSVGNGNDFVGHCINTASRLQKLSLLTFCFPHRGFDIQQYMHEGYRRLFIKKRVSVRGVGENEQVWVLKDEFNRLPERSREMFRDP